MHKKVRLFWAYFFIRNLITQKTVLAKTIIYIK